MQKLEVQCIHRTMGQGSFLTTNAIFIRQNQLNDKKSRLLSRCHQNEPDVLIAVPAATFSIYSTNV